MIHPSATHRIEPEAERDRLVEEQAALRRVATLVASGVEPGPLFDALAGEAEALFGADISAVVRFEGDGTVTAMGAHGGPHSREARAHVDPDYVVAAVHRTGQPAGFDLQNWEGEPPAVVRDWGVRWALATPVVVEGELWGAITIASFESVLVAGTDGRLADFSALFATAIANAQSREALAALVEEQAALRRVATLAARELAPVEVLVAVTEEAARALETEAVGMIRFDYDGAATLVAQSQPPWDPPPLGTRFTLEGENVVVWVHRTGQTARMDDWTGATGSVAALAHVLGVSSAVATPIIVEGRLWGTMVAATNQSKPLPADTESRIGEFTELVATAIANAQSREALAALAEEQAALRRVATLVATSAPPERVLGAVAEEVGNLLGRPEIHVVRYGADETATVIGASGGHPFAVGSRWSFDGPSIAASVYRTGQTARIDDYSQLPGTTAKVARERGFESAIGAPIIVAGAVWGAIIVISTVPERIPEGSETRLALFTELVGTAISNLQAHDDLRSLAEEQAALRRVATLVAKGVDAQDIFDAVCQEACRLLDATTVTLSHYTPDGFNVSMADSLKDTHLPIGTRLRLEPDTVGDAIVRTRAPARVDSWEGRSSAVANLLRKRGVRSSLGAPIVVEGQLWGALVAGTDQEEPLPAGTEFRLARFTELIATAISNAATRSELITSRARIVAAGDEARQRIERNLHDGTQQRLIALGLDIQRVRATIPEDQHDAHLELERVEEDLQSVLEDLRELSRGLHPPLLSRRGLRSALRALARDSPIPVELEIDLPERSPAPLETAVYYVVSESLTNAIKHSQASVISITIETDHAGEPFGVGLDGRSGGANLHATIADDGVGGADPSAGSGLTGLADRVDALGGRFALDTPGGGGTRISIELPLEIR